MKLADLIKQAVPDLSGDVLKSLLHDLEKVGHDALVQEAGRVTARALLKGIDAFVAVAVAHLPVEDAEELTGAYADVLTAQLKDLSEATFDYIPLQVAVEAAKRAHGAKSAEAAAARQAREAGITEMRAEVRDVLLAASGGEPGD
jgi:hypothetical protein